MKRKLFLFTLLASALFTACSSGSDDEPETPPTTPTNPTERKLIIGVGANPWLDENGNARETRGDMITTQTLQRFLMKAYNSSEDLATYIAKRDNENKWIPTPVNGDVNVGGDWPIMDINDPVSFYAYTAGTCYYESGYYVAFNSEEASGFQHDLLLSKITNVTYSGTGGVIWFTFDHACAAVEFNIQITNKLKTEKGIESLTVNSVVLTNIAKTGDCYYSTGSRNHIGEWKNVGEPQGNETSGFTNYTLTQVPMTVGTSSVALPCNTMFIIPQRLGSDAGLEISYSFEGQNKTARISLEGTEWEAGHLYPINIVLGTTLIK